MRLIDPDSGEVVVEAVDAGGILGRMRGLIGRPPPPSGYGMKLRTKQVHTFGMKFPIDAVYLAADGTVLRVVRLSPRKLGPFVLRAKWVIELAADEANRLGIRPGRILGLEK